MKPILRLAINTLLIALTTPLTAGAATYTPTPLYTVEALNLTASGCQQNCTEIEISYPRILKALTPQAQTRINQAIQTTLVQSLSFEAPQANLQAAIETFFADAGQYQDDLPEAPPWQLMLTVKPESYGERLLSLRVESYVFTGGAHGNPATDFISFDLQSGQTLTLADVLLPGAEQALTQLGEERFRADRGISPDKDLQEEGYEFENNRFHLPKVVGLGRYGLVFVYNVYEIGPYSAGTFELFIGYDALKKLIKPAYLKALLPETRSL
ncbi:MAG: DUF3298 and DUF4163 domain-containing protein [Candidatus Sericytochromatia bacterium]